MASQRQIQDQRESTQEDSIENGAAQQELADASKEKKKTDKSSKSATESEDDAAPTQIESLLQVLQGDLSALDPDAALKAIDELYKVVHQSKQPEAKEIGSGLKELQKLLKRKEPNGHELGELIEHLGAQTNDIAADADKSLKTPLQHLGKQLSKVGRSLAKAEDQQQLESLDAVVEMLEKPNPSDTKAAVGEIDRWYEVLDKSEQKSFKAIASELKQLKQLLKGNKAKGGDLSEKLIELGEQTTAAASDADRGFKGVVQKIGKALTKFGKSLA
jgi:ABC-type transporter Mla subunit MlaD